MPDSQAAKHDPQPSRIGREQFRQDPASAVRMAIDVGRLLVTDAQGKTVLVISAPADKRPVIDD